MLCCRGQYVVLQRTMCCVVEGGVFCCRGQCVVL